MSNSDFIFDFDFGFGPRRKRKRRRARWKIFERGDLKFVILRLISREPMHGYEVMKALKEESGGLYSPSPGSVYPTLQMLEDEGYVKSEDKDGKTVYSITEEGQAYLDENEDLVDDVFERVENFTDRFFGEDMQRLSRAYSKITSLTFDEALRWGTERDDLVAMSKVLERAVEDLQEIRSSRRRERRRGRSDDSDE